MTSIEEADTWIGRTAVDSAGEQIGMITKIWVDDASGEPAWASLKSQALRGREALVPLAGGAAYGGGRRFAYTKEAIFGAPQGDRNGHLEVEDMERLSSYYGAPDTEPGSANWIDRLEDAANGSTVREISTMLEGTETISAPQAPAEPKSGRRFGRKPGPSKPKTKAKRGFRRKASPADQQPADLAMDHDEAAVGR